MPAQKILNAVEADALMSLLGGVTGLVDLLHVRCLVFHRPDSVCHMDDAVFAPLENIQVNAEGLVLVGLYLVDGVLQQISDDLVGFVDAGDHTAQVVLNVQMQLNPVFLGHGAKAEDQRGNGRVLHREQGVHGHGILHQIVYVAAAFLQIPAVDQSSQGLNVEIIIMPLGADHAHKGLYFIPIVLIHQRGDPFLPIGHQQADAAQTAPEQQTVAAQQGRCAKDSLRLRDQISQRKLRQGHKPQRGPDVPGSDGSVLRAGKAVRPPLLWKAAPQDPSQGQKQPDQHQLGDDGGKRGKQTVKRLGAAVQQSPQPHRQE